MSNMLPVFLDPSDLPTSITYVLSYHVLNQVLLLFLV